MSNPTSNLKNALAEWDRLRHAREVMHVDGIGFDVVLTRRALAMERIIEAARATLSVETPARREYHANGTYWSGVPTIDMPCDFCGRAIMDHDPRTHACSSVETSDEPPVMGAVGGVAPMPTALEAIEAHVRQIQIICDATGNDPTQWLNDETAQGSSVETTGGAGDSMRTALADLGRSVLDSWKEKDGLAERLTQALEAAKAELEATGLELIEAREERDRLRGEAEVADEQLAQLRGFAEAHKTCVGVDEIESLRVVLAAAHEAQRTAEAETAKAMAAHAIDLRDNTQTVASCELIIARAARAYVRQWKADPNNMLDVWSDLFKAIEAAPEDAGDSL